VLSEVFKALAVLSPWDYLSLLAISYCATKVVKALVFGRPKSKISSNFDFDLEGDME
jgi:hypothetical protein